jgi:hypothetical protein
MYVLLTILYMHVHTYIHMYTCVFFVGCKQCADTSRGMEHVRTHKGYSALTYNQSSRHYTYAYWTNPVSKQTWLQAHTQTLSYRQAERRMHTAHTKSNSPKLGCHSQSCHVAMPVRSWAFCLAHNVPHKPPIRGLRHFKVLWPTHQVLQVEGEIVLQNGVRINQWLFAPRHARSSPQYFRTYVRWKSDRAKVCLLVLLAHGYDEL